MKEELKERHIKYFKIDGISCQDCINKISSYLWESGFSIFGIDASNHIAWCFIPEGKTPSDFIDTVRKAGYNASAYKSEEGINTNLYNLLILTIPAVYFILSMFIHHDFFHKGIVQLFMASVSLVIGLRLYLAGAISSFLTLRPNMNFLILSGSIAAYIYSVVLLIKGEEHFYFESTSLILAIVSLGHLIEAKLSKSFLPEIEKFLNIGNKNIKKYDNGKINLAPIFSLKPQDKIMVTSGDMIPVDGQIIDGKIEVNVASITGEPYPKILNTGDLVMAGSTVISGQATLIAKDNFINSAYGRILSSIISTQYIKTPVRKLVDKISYYFTYGVLFIGILTVILGFFLGLSFNESLLRGIAVIVVACPCALGIATPIVYALTVKKAIKFGIFIKSPISVEIFPKTKTFLFDKTGTLTSTEFHINKITVLGSFTEKEIVRTVYQVERYSSHPIAKAIIKEIEKKYPEITSLDDNVKIEEIPGKGIVGHTSNGTKITIFRDEMAQNFDALTLLVNINDKPAGKIEIDTPDNPELSDFFKYLKKENVEIKILSGDATQRVKLFAEKYGISEYYGEMLPYQKRKLILELKQKNKDNKIAMIGDGVNDASAMSVVDIGISFGEATELTRSVSSIIIMGSNLKKILLAWNITKYGYHILKLNLFWAFAYNVILIPLAVIGYVSPSLAALAMTFSDITLLFNSFRIVLKKWNFT